MPRKKKQVFHKYISVEISPTTEQQKQLNKQFILQQDIWNYLVENWNQEIEEKKKETTDFLGYINRMSQTLEKDVKEKFANKINKPFISARLVRGAIGLYIKAWRRYSLVKNTGKPDFHSRNAWTRSLYIPDIERKFGEKVSLTHFKLATQTSCPKEWSMIRYKNRDVVDRIKSLNGQVVQYTINEKTKRYYLHLCVEFPELNIQISGNGELALDWGLTNFFTDQYGNTYNLPYRVTYYCKKITKLKQLLFKKQKNSKNYKKLKEKLDKATQRYSRIKEDWIEKTTTKLLRENKLICLENLDLEHLIKKGSHYRREKMKINSFGMFRDRLVQKSLEYTCEVVLVDRFFASSQICSVCGNKEFKPLSQRTVQCKCCGNNIDRDQNAAINLLKAGKQQKCN